MEARSADHLRLAEQLHNAVTRNNPEHVTTLLAGGADVNDVGYGNVSPLHRAAEKGLVGIGEILLAAKANVEAVNRDGQRPIHLAIKFDSPSFLSLLVGRGGCDVTAPNAEKLTPLHCAAAKGSAEMLKIIIDALTARAIGAISDGTAVPITSNPFLALDTESRTPLRTAIAFGSEEAAAILIRAQCQWMRMQQLQTAPIAEEEESALRPVVSIADFNFIVESKMALLATRLLETALPLPAPKACSESEGGADGEVDAAANSQPPPLDISVPRGACDDLLNPTLRPSHEQHPSFIHDQPIIGIVGSHQLDVCRAFLAYLKDRHVGGPFPLDAMVTRRGELTPLEYLILLPPSPIPVEPMIQLLLDSGLCDVSRPSPSTGYTPLHSAISTSKTGVVELILSSDFFTRRGPVGAACEDAPHLSKHGWRHSLTPKQALSHRNNLKETPMGAAVAFNSHAAMAALLREGASIEGADLLLPCIEQGRAHCAACLFDNGADTEVSSDLSDGRRVPIGEHLAASLVQQSEVEGIAVRLPRSVAKVLIVNGITTEQKDKVRFGVNCLTL